MKRRPHRSDLQITSQLSVWLDKITNRISFARIKIASDQFRVKNRPYLKLNFRLGLFSNRSWSKAPEVSYGLFFFFLAPSMNGRAQLCWSFPNFKLNFGSGRHFAGNAIYEWSGLTLPVFPFKFRIGRTLCRSWRWRWQRGASYEGASHNRSGARSRKVLT